MRTDDQLEHLSKLREEARLGGGQKRIDKQHEKSLITARERIDLRLDKALFRRISICSRPIDAGISVWISRSSWETV